MESIDNYSIAYKGLPNGTHNFRYEIGKEFFDSIEMSMIEDGKLTAAVSMTKSDAMLKFHFDIEGTIKAVCDICLDTFDYEVEECGGDIMVKFGEKNEEISEELYVLAYDENEISVAQWIYELICVSLPIQFVHPDDENGNSTCNAEMLKTLDRFLVKEKNDSDEETESGEETSDPRWDALKGLLNKNK